MAVWLPAQNKFYLPPQPVTKIISTDEYVTRTSLYYHASSERLLTVGHPYFEIKKQNGVDNSIVIPKVSPNQYRVFRIKLPDPNNFAFGDKHVFDPEKERLVWSCVGVEIDRGQPLGIPVTGSPLLNRAADVENPNQLLANTKSGETRKNVAFDPKQTQLFIIGCKPAIGEHWAAAKWCEGEQHQVTNCPPLELINTMIEDGDMVDIGFGAMDFKNLQPNRAGVPLDINMSICKYPDYIKMSNDNYGDTLFFFARREQLYARHMFSRGGVVKETMDEGTYFNRKEGGDIPTYNYFVTPSGSLVSSESQLFNRPYWLHKAQGMNNGILWQNQMFITLVDNTRGTIMNINTVENNANFDAENTTAYIRHVEEFELSFIFQLCKIKLTPENLAFIHTMNPDIIEQWHLGVTAPNLQLDDRYRYINSLATKCPADVVVPERVDPYEGRRFWEIDLTEQMSDQLDQTPLGRKFLFQRGYRTSTKRVSVRTTTAVTKTKAKRRRKA
ncbi:L1 protein [Talpa europaea papillomavirus 1]|uniref:Major capsid protein L1 n=1 Tax=Talpa europaea papillomavirus 1 TaxID=1338506 RepID=R9RX95_9PAPI|nr:L1 protein [Talpa europaea papillomavirus 1]AGM75111.1 L1 protein [Talpa europaea papillomavirus 1]AGM75118.1 L1 protein [Talpa europaea papillomavirus 1]